MFIIVPLIIILLCISYLQVNDNVDFYIKIVIYLIILVVVFVSLKLYRKIKKDLKAQDINSIIVEIKRIEKKIASTQDEKMILGLQKKIELLKKEKIKE